MKIADVTMLVRVPGQPAAVRVFTDAERAEADTYAAATGGTVVQLPLPGVVISALADSQTVAREVTTVTVEGSKPRSRCITVASPRSGPTE
jgi:hypothetical protein